MTRGSSSSLFVQELGFLWGRYYRSTAQRRVVDLVLKHYDDLIIPKPSRRFLYGTALDAMILDLVVLWDRNGKGSLVCVARRLVSMREPELAKYIGSLRRGQDPRGAGRFVEEEGDKINESMRKLVTARNTSIAHLDRPAAQEELNAEKGEIDEIQAASLSALKRLGELVHVFPPVGGAILTDAGENLVLDLCKSSTSR